MDLNQTYKVLIHYRKKQYQRASSGFFIQALFKYFTLEIEIKTSMRFKGLSFERKPLYTFKKMYCLVQ